MEPKRFCEVHRENERLQVYCSKISLSTTSALISIVDQWSKCRSRIVAKLDWLHEVLALSSEAQITAYNTQASLLATVTGCQSIDS